MSRFLFSLHSWMGLIAGLGLLVIGLTGSVIVFREELDGLLHPEHVFQPDPHKPALPLDSLISTMQKHMDGHVLRSFGPSPRADRNLVAYVTPVANKEDWKLYLVDPATGIPTSKEPLQTSDSLTATLVNLHYTFFADHVGEAVVGILGLMLCLLGLSGFWLYRSFWRTFFQLRWGRTVRILFSDLHKMVGISSMLFNLVLGFSGAWWNLTHIIGHLIEETPQESTQTFSGPVYNTSLSFDSLLAKAKAEFPEFKLSWTSLPSKPEDPILFFGKRENQGILRSDYGNNAVFNAQTGELLSVSDIRESSIWMQIVDAFRPLHFGSFGGLPVKILWSLGGLTPAILAISGSIMWFKRRKPKKATNKKRAAISERPSRSEAESIAS